LGSLPALTLGAAIPASLPILFFALFIFIIYVAARLSFILPATAIGEKYTLSNSWKHTDRQGWRLVGTFIIVTTPYALLIIVINQAFESAFISELPSITTNASQVNFENHINDLNQYFLNNGPEIFILNLFIIALTYLPTATTITALSIAFKGCTGWVPEQPEETVDG
ncbi:hypothetical protein, partial [uncultured Kiloniella sp.]|uniref:hypothetical protein n=1 Tax=uncultured Kiloniella sp. TaxID=1133091 RepID=UPI00260D0F08